MTKKYRFLMVSILLGIILSILGCGDDFDTQNSSSSIKTGTFIDSPVEGLHYTTPTLSGFTNTKGEFQYKSGEMIRFSLGNLSLGEVQARKLITPLTLCGEYDLNNIGIKATNIARVLQTLGHNATSSTRLTIPTELRDLNISDINLELETDLNSLLVRAEALNGVNYVLVDSESAKNEMRNHIEEYNTIPGEVSTTTIESTTDTTSTVPSPEKGQKFYAKKLKKACGVSGDVVANKHTQAEWTEIKDAGKMAEEIKTICPNVTSDALKDIYLEYYYDFFYKFASDSGNTPSC